MLFLQDYCALQELLMKMNFTIAVAPPFVHPMTSLPATPTHSVRKYGFLSEPTQRRQLAKYGNLKRCESLSFSGDIESLKNFNSSGLVALALNFNPTRLLIAGIVSEL